jgi:hypothetical protein
MIFISKTHVLVSFVPHHPDPKYKFYMDLYSLRSRFLFVYPRKQNPIIAVKRKPKIEPIAHQNEYPQVSALTSAADVPIVSVITLSNSRWNDPAYVLTAIIFNTIRVSANTGNGCANQCWQQQPMQATNHQKRANADINKLMVNKATTAALQLGLLFQLLVHR